MMWFSRPIDLARSVFRPPPPATAIAVARVAAVSAIEASPTEIHLELTRRDLDRFAAALLASLAPADGHIEDPARLAAALDLLIALMGGAGRSRVVLRPAGLATPETWQITIDGADDRTALAVDRLQHGIPIPLQPTGGSA
jgi:hypothetical protein